MAVSVSVAGAVVALCPAQRRCGPPAGEAGYREAARDRASATTSARPRDADLRRHVRAAVVVIVHGVLKIVLADGDGHRRGHDRSCGSQTSGNAWLIVIDAWTSSTRASHWAGRKSKATLSNVYLTIWCEAGSTQSVMSATLFIMRRISASVALPAFERSPRGPSRIASEQLRRVVLDAQHVVAVERLAADERVLAFFELEAQKVGRRDELRAAAPGAGWRRRPSAPPHRPRGCAGRGGVPRRRSSSRCRFRIQLRRSAVRLADGDAVELDRAADEEAVADEPGVLAALAPERRVERAAQLDLLALVEDVLLQLLPVVVAASRAPAA